MKEQKLFMVLVGATPKGRHTEQHDVFFGIGESLNSLVPAIEAFWPEANGRVHIDAWREVTYVDGHAVRVRARGEAEGGADKLYFINLGGYKPGEVEEYH